MMFATVSTPDLLAKIKAGTMVPAELTFAAEELGLRSDCTSEAIDVLIGLLSHKSSLVREGAIYGLEPHKDLDEVDEAFNELRFRETSWGFYGPHGSNGGLA